MDFQFITVSFKIDDIFCSKSRSISKVVTSIQMGFKCVATD